MNTGNIFQQLIAATFPVGGYEMHYLELIGILIGAASAYLGMKRWVWAWPVGIIANVMLFFVYLGALFGADQRIPLFGQAGRQIFFIATSLYGWWRWNQSRRARGVDTAGPAITPRWATSRERTGIVVGWLLGTVIVHQVFVALWDLAPTPTGRRPGGSTGATRGSSSGRSSRPTRWPGAGTSSGWPGSPSTSSGCRWASPRAMSRPPCSTSSTACSSLYGFTQWVKATREERPTELPTEERALARPTA